MCSALSLQLLQLFWCAYLKARVPKIPQKKKDWKLLCKTNDKS